MTIDNNAVDLLMAQPTGTGTPWAKFPELGSVVTGTVVSVTTKQRLEYETNEPLMNKDGSPAMEIVIVLATDERDATIDEDNGHRALHAPIWYFSGCLKVAISVAVANAGRTRPEVGGTLTVQHIGMDGRAKTYQAKYVPPAEAAVEAAFAPAPTAAAPTFASIL